MSESKLKKTLYFKEGSSDKVYSVQVVGGGDAFSVEVAFGRRGGSMSTITKTQSPVTLEAATKVFEKLVAEKERKGYREGEDGASFQPIAAAAASSPYRPQLLNDVDEGESKWLVDSRAHYMQEKFDGRRIFLQKRDGAVVGINKKGDIIPLPQPLVDEAACLAPQDFVLDGELCGEHFHAFDLLRLEKLDIRNEPYSERFLTLFRTFASRKKSRRVSVAATEHSPSGKRVLYAQLREQKAEGVVFKDSLAPYIAGRPASGGAQLKVKFYATLSARVARANQKRSVALELVTEDGAWISVGNVTVPPNAEIPPAGSVVEVRYLYAYPHGSLYQPTYLGQRDDVDAAECLAAQRKFKREDEAGEEEK